MQLNLCSKIHDHKASVTHCITVCTEAKNIVIVFLKSIETSIVIIIIPNIDRLPIVSEDVNK